MFERQVVKELSEGLVTDEKELMLSLCGFGLCTSRFLFCICDELGGFPVGELGAGARCEQLACPPGGAPRARAEPWSADG